jgi:hypothetical protein
VNHDDAHAKLIAELEALPRFLIQGQGFHAYVELLTILMKYLDATGAPWELSTFLGLLRSDVVAAEAELANKGKPGPKRSFEKTAALAMAAAGVTALKAKGRGVDEATKDVAKASKTISASQIKKFRDSINRATVAKPTIKMYETLLGQLGPKTVDDIMDQMNLAGIMFVGRHRASSITWDDL